MPALKYASSAGVAIFLGGDPAGLMSTLRSVFDVPWTIQDRPPELMEQYSSRANMLSDPVFPKAALRCPPTPFKAFGMQNVPQSEALFTSTSGEAVFAARACGKGIVAALTDIYATADSFALIADICKHRIAAQGYGTCLSCHPLVITAHTCFYQNQLRSW